MTGYETTTTAEGRPAFRKYGAASDRFQAEAEGLAALAATGLVRVPEVLEVSGSELVTELIEQGSPSREGWEVLGRQLAAMQALEQPCFGFTGDNYCGDTPQPNPRTGDGFAFFSEHRLGFQGRLAMDAGLLEADDIRALEQLCGQLDSLVPQQGPSLLHGDLWNGNVLFDRSGEPVLIDPACYWGWPEAEIAMCGLFGGFPEAFYASWEAAADPEPGWRERLPLYQLYHLLNHLNLFGSAYHGQVVNLLNRWG
jgi:fructosamine-3-kinase